MKCCYLTMVSWFQNHVYTSESLLKFETYLFEVFKNNFRNAYHSPFFIAESLIKIIIKMLEFELALCGIHIFQNKIDIILVCLFPSYSFLISFMSSSRLSFFSHFDKKGKIYKRLKRDRKSHYYLLILIFSSFKNKRFPPLF